MMRASELVTLLGKRATWTVAPNIDIEVEIIDAKTAYGVFRILVAPVHGKGRTWVALTTVHDVREAA